MTESFLSIPRQCLPNKQIWKPEFILSSKKIVPLREVASLVEVWTITLRFSQWWPLSLNMQYGFRYASYFVTQNIKKMCTQNLKFNETGFFFVFFIVSVAVMNIKTTSRVWCHYFHSKMPAVLSAISFAPLEQMSIVNNKKIIS